MRRLGLLVGSMLWLASPAFAVCDKTTGILNDTLPVSQTTRDLSSWASMDELFVTAFDASGNESVESNVVVFDPAAPAGLTLVWDAPTTDEGGVPLTGLDGYKVYRCPLDAVAPSAPGNLRLQ